MKNKALLAEISVSHMAQTFKTVLKNNKAVKFIMTTVEDLENETVELIKIIILLHSIVNYSNFGYV